ncbi:MAG: hypothetical protein J7J93_01315 [Candidatus Aenigmarchaeota archaeon]|nr:hypothetical protein [Candidatus Aenigmarchaeota archaeon]
MNEDFFIDEINNKLSGIIWRKALLDGNFDKVYSKVFEEIAVNKFENEINILEIFGEVGG